MKMISRGFGTPPTSTQRCRCTVGGLSAGSLQGSSRSSTWAPAVQVFRQGIARYQVSPLPPDPPALVQHLAAPVAASQLPEGSLLSHFLHLGER